MISNSNFKDNTFIQRAENVKMETDKDTILFYQQRIYFLEQMIDLKEKEIEARDRDIEIFKDLMEEVRISREMLKELYERKVQDLKRTIEILQGNKLS